MKLVHSFLFSDYCNIMY